MSYETFITEDARLVILRSLAGQNDRRLNQSLIQKQLDLFGHRQSRDWVRTQLRALKDLGAIALSEASDIMIAELTRAGEDHVDGRSIIEGVARPSAKG